MDSEKYLKLKITELEMKVSQLEAELKAMKIIPHKAYYSVKEYAELMSVTTQTVYNQLHSGSITAVKIGSEWRIPSIK